MSASNWSDYHAWRVHYNEMATAETVLAPEAYAALKAAAEPVAGWPGYSLPREAIEDAALAMPEAQAASWLELVYDLLQDHAGAEPGRRLLAAIKWVRETTR